MSPYYDNLWWAIDGILAGMGVPYIDAERRQNFGGELAAYHDELPDLYGAGIRAVVCLLNIPSDEKVFRSAGFDFNCLPIPDGHPPTMAQANVFVEFVDSWRLRKLPVAVFCEAGIGRTGTMICCYMIHIGMTAEAAVAYVRTKEPMAVETASQRSFLDDFEVLQMQ
jgi:atypical dual specificity phosphatase